MLVNNDNEKILTNVMYTSREMYLVFAMDLLRNT